MYQFQSSYCRGYMLCILRDNPSLRMDAKGDYIAKIVVGRDRQSEALYCVYIYGEQALRIRQYGFVGLQLWIEGDFQNNGEIIAQKISFVDFPTSGNDARSFT